ncbi:Predicted Zn-dependent protease, minimal metalloprotease (MMP)-like domain [Nonomuraea maritima]|uniref:Predicted Zn-dependent protease, minimal metalloprotease (MMP)-like domain n=1 Tax=Nonomuraea maritima TaxID=683260 RepID=A0A1G9RIJ1_9ACTN|nr:metallopeptidase family protein [Nonomuraea maritima]SDM23058.1 Predicted Zn-dependent protease, minimal metalloprotease (MMP)-like domain [Nonomuraea maritima]
MASVIWVSREKFEQLVAEALDTIPPELARAMSNVVVTVVDEAPEPDLLGLYTGVPLTERGDWYSAVLPDCIEIYRDAICEICETEEDVIREVRITVIHEVGHHFGIDDARLHELGW